MPRYAPLCLAVAGLVLTACGDSGGLPGARAGGSGGSGGGISPAMSACGPMPAAGQSIAGRTCTIRLTGPKNEVVVFNVFEPDTLVGGQTYPLILHSHGFGGSKESGKTGVIGQYTANGYGAISLDERGFGQSTGSVRVMDPDAEGQIWLQVLDWTETNLPWMAYGADDDAPPSAQPNPIIGAIGGSYGGGYQLMIHAIDPQKRLDAIVPDITWTDLSYSLNPGNVPKSGWAKLLYGVGNSGAPQSGNTQPFDPFVTNLLLNSLISGRMSAEGQDFLRYHGLDYFCDGRPLATGLNGDALPMYAPTRPSRIDALLTQGFRDTLFNFSESYNNYQCLKAAGGDVRLMTYQSGHNTLQAVPDPGQAFQPPGSTASSNCGALGKDAAALAFFNQHLKGMSGAASVIPPICLSLAGSDAVQPATITAGLDGTVFDVPATTVLSGGVPNVASAAQLGAAAIAPVGGLVFAGIPYAELTVTSATAPLPAPGNDPIIFVGIGHRRAAGAGARLWDLMDNQLTPIRGLGEFKIDLVGVAERLNVGDEVALLFYGNHDQFDLTGARPPNNFPVSVTGKVWLPLLPGDTPTVP